VRLLLAAALLASCASLPVLDVFVSPATYSPAMSSRVGIGFEPKYAEGARYRFTCDYGHFVSWGAPDYQIIPHGADFMAGPEKVYWTYDGGVPVDRRPVIVNIEAMDRGGRMLSSAVVFLDWTDDGVAMRK
jgi:hypothetical protein